jgi:hypothetical protein
MNSFYIKIFIGLILRIILLFCFSSNHSYFNWTKSQLFVENSYQNEVIIECSFRFNNKIIFNEKTDYIEDFNCPNKNLINIISIVISKYTQYNDQIIILIITGFLFQFFTVILLYFSSSRLIYLFQNSININNKIKNVNDNIDIKFDIANLDKKIDNQKKINAYSHLYNNAISNTFDDKIRFNFINRSLNYYWLNPIIIIISIISPLPAFFHFLLLLAIILSTQERYILVIIISLISSILHSTYIYILPLIYLYMYQNDNKQLENKSKNNDDNNNYNNDIYIITIQKMKTMISNVQFSIIISCCVNFTPLLFSSTGFIQNYTKDLFNLFKNNLFKNNLLVSNVISNHYYPSSGIVWYLDALIFNNFRKYFSLFLCFQPFLFIISSYIRIGNNLKFVYIQICMIYILFYKSDVCFADFVYCFTFIFCFDNNIISNMNYISILSLVLLFTSILSPVTLSLWVIYGTGNSNFLFFQGLVMWIFISIFTVDYFKSIIKS